MRCGVFVLACVFSVRVVGSSKPAVDWSVLRPPPQRNRGRRLMAALLTEGVSDARGQQRCIYVALEEVKVF